ncbi:MULTISPECIES: 50S ribosomal protein L24 [Enorma]|uniref:Large ribosomal subunit protein uL24 n=1 Tax=Enorma phocaeensis TaxID=1871019 RepID=A0A921IUN5_9ACTN|nr:MULTISPECIES: 50S ribosomal protein L24 [Enorma]MCI7730896.1 50S ribosomal protein L24 [Enorma burkinafasonensis]HJG37468.1 50S ribosomal protein L24 [Enorma phocaeensis]
MAKMSIKKGDTVKILSGKDRGKQGTVLHAYPAEGKIKVEGVAIVKKAVRPNQQNQTGGIVSQEAKIDASNAQLVCPKCGAATRVGHKQGEIDGHKTSIRVCKKCGAEF